MSRLSVVMTMRLAAIDLFLLWYGALVSRVSVHV
jgi:hypothetical protein